jgi:hypothetical protein
LSSVVLVVIIILYVCSEPSGLSDTELSTCLSKSDFYVWGADSNVYTYAQVKRADEARLAGSKRSKNQGPCQAQDWSVERKEDVSSWGKNFLARRTTRQDIWFTAIRLVVSCTGA